MNYRVKESISNMAVISYAKNTHITTKKDYIDCYAGSNPLGYSNKVLDALKNLNGEMIGSYPEVDTLKDKIADQWQDVVTIDYDNIILGEGSISILTTVNSMFLEKGEKTFGYVPQFSDFGVNVEAHGGIYETMMLLEEENFRFNSKRCISAMNGNYKLIYIDNPNNPTGQIIDIEEIESIVKKAESMNVCVVVDEAYGDFMPRENSAISLMDRYSNVIVYRSFSKGWGMAGLRAGYGVMSKQLCSSMKKITNPYQMSALSRYIIEQVIEDEDFVIKSIEANRCMKQRLMKPWKQLTIKETSHSTPICLITHRNKNVDLAKLLMDQGIKTVSGCGFRNLGKNSIRLRLPKVDQLNAVIQALEIIDNYV